jgi:hypothetical protein
MKLRKLKLKMCLLFWIALSIWVQAKTNLRLKGINYLLMNLIAKIGAKPRGFFTDKNN